MYFNKVIKLIKNKYFPSRHQLVVRQWLADGGDFVFRFNYDLNKNSVVLDLGGYKGQWASDIFARYCCYIFIFEPVSEFFELIRNRFDKNEKVMVFPFGLGGYTRSTNLHVSGDGSSIFVKTGNIEKIEIVDINSWIEHYISNEKDIDLLKVNIEGGEYELLERIIETDLIKKISNLQIQFHEISKHSKYEMEKIQSSLMNTHSITYKYEFVWENWKRKNIH